MAAPIYRGGPPFNSAYYRFPNAVCVPLQGTGAPTDGTSGTGAGVAGPGSVYIDNTAAVGAWYFNSNTKASPTWTAFGSTAGAATPSSVTSSGLIKSTSPTAGIGYATGAGGTVTQGTSRTTGVTLNKITGAITLFSEAGSQSYQTFTVTNSTVAATDVVIVSQKSGTDPYQLNVTNVAAGSFKITAAAISGSTTEAPVINFAVIKGVAA